MQIAERELCADADDAVAEARELAITARVSQRATRVNGAIKLNDEPDAWCTEVSDELAANGSCGGRKRPAALLSRVRSCR